MASNIIFSLVCALFLVAYGYGEEGVVALEKMVSERPHEAPQIKDPIKTIMAKDGDIIDCVDIYKQPALDHPLLKNHKIQIRSNYHGRSKSPSIPISNLNIENFEYESCPQYTVPIMRTKHLHTNLKRPISKPKAPNGGTYHRAGYVSYVSYKTDYYYANQAGIGVYGLPQVRNNQTSAAHIYLHNARDIVAAGWHVRPNLYGDSKTRLMVWWTAQNSTEVGCFDLFCPGFVQVHPRIRPGSIIEPLSVYGGDQYYIQLIIYREVHNGNYELHKTDGGNEIFIGYWPRELFEGLQSGAARIGWAGLVTYAPDEVGPPMGSGHFANNGRGKAAFFQNISYQDGRYIDHDPSPFSRNMFQDSCYNVGNLGVEPGHEDEGYKFYFGGPAGCPSE